MEYITPHQTRGYHPLAAQIASIKPTQAGPVRSIDDIDSVCIERTGDIDWEPELCSVISAIDSLSNMERNVLIMHVWLDRSITQIANHFEMTQSEVCMVYWDAFLHLRQILRDRQRAQSMRDAG